MEPHTCLTLVFFVLVNLAVGVLSTDNYSRQDFPVDFVFGSGTSAYQVLFYFTPKRSNHAISLFRIIKL